ncbi:MAG: hypothetical protein KBT11_11050 [Treponema sp.]|nr:hypothetical protein [Candidatus Treponema equifaecale]
MILTTLFYYLATSSAVLFYGIGINRTVSIKDDMSEAMFSCFKSLTTGASTSALTYLVTTWLLIPIHLAELYPLLAILFFVIFNTLTEIFFGIRMTNTNAEFTITLLSVFLGLNEGLSIGYAVIITCTCIISFFVLVLIFHSIKERISFYTTQDSLKIYSIMLLCLAVTMIAICGSNITWLNLSLGGGAK